MEKAKWKTGIEVSEMVGGPLELLTGTEFREIRTDVDKGTWNKLLSMQSRINRFKARQRKRR